MKTLLIGNGISIQFAKNDISNKGSNPEFYI